MPAWTPKAAAALVALICWAALGIRLSETYQGNGDLAASLWILARFFTILTIFAVAVAMTFAAFERRLSDFLLGGLALSIMLVGIVYVTLLEHLYHLQGTELLADNLMHKVAPVAMALFWFTCPPHGRLKWTAPLWWALFPIVYFAYALVRGATDGIYPYPFMDVGKLGYGQTLLNAAMIAAAFLVTGLVLVWLDRRVLGDKTLKPMARR